MGLGLGGCQLNHPPKMPQGLVRPVGFQQDRAEGGMTVGVAGGGAHKAAEQGLGLTWPSQLLEKEREIAEGPRIARLGAEHRPIASDGFVAPAQLAMDIPEIVVGLGEVGLEGQGTPYEADAFIRPAGLVADQPEVVLGRREGAIDAQRGLIAGRGLGQISGLVMTQGRFERRLQEPAHGGRSCRGATAAP